jgi:putative cell wall-binding protein
MPDEAPAATLHALRAVGATDALLLGGTGALSNDVAVQLSSAGIATSRIGGADRYETARLLAEEAIEAVGLQWSGVSIATGANFPDALAGGVLQAKTGSVILLTKSSTLSESAASALAENSDLIGEVRFLGGQAALSADVREQVIAALGW